MSESILRLKIQSEEYDNKLKRATEQLSRYADGCRKAGGTLQYVDDGIVEFARSLGKMETSATTARGQLAEMTKAFTEWSVRYNKLTDEEKKGEFGKALSQSLDQLKVRIKEAQSDLKSITQELQGGRFGQFGGIIDGIGQKMGLTGSLTEMLTSRTALMTAGLGAAAAAIGKSTEMWAKYNAELARQDQQTTVITGLKGNDADRMTDTMRALSDTYKVDFRQAVEAANTLMSQFGESGDSAIQIIKDGMQGMIQGDGPKLLQMIQQYAPAFRDAGVSASQLVAVIQNSEGGLFTDQNMNAIVMGIKNIRLMTKQTGDALAQLGIDGDKMSKQLNDGTLTVFDALKQVSKQLQTVDSNSKTAGEVMQTVFGRHGAMAGTNLAKAIEQLNTNLDDTKKQTGEVGEAFAELQTANEKLNVAIREAFSYDGWEQMAAGIRASLITALAEVVGWLGKIREMLSGDLVDVKITPKPGVQNLANDPNVDDHGNYITKPWNNKPAPIKFYGEEESPTKVNPPKPTKSKPTTTKTPKTEEQLNNEEIQKLTQEYIKASDERRKVIEGEIKTLQDRNKEIARLKDMALGKIGDDGSLPAMTQQLKEFQNAQSESANGREWDDYQKKIDDVTAKINVLKGVLPKDQQATFTVEVNAEQLEQLRMLLPSDEETVRINVEEGGIDLPDIPTEIEQVVNTKVGDVVTPEIATDIVQTISTRLGSIVTPDIAETLTQVINTKVGDVVTPEIAKELTQVINVEPGTVNLPAIPKEDETIRVNITATTEDAMKEVRDMVGEIEGWEVAIEPKIEIDEQDLRTPFEKLKDSLKIEIAEENMQVDTTTLQTLMKTSIQNGIDGLDPDFSALQEKMREGMNIPDETWQALQDNINEKLKELGIDPIKIDFQTGNIAKDGKDVAKEWNSAANAISSVGSAMQSIEDPSAKIVGTIAQAIATIALTYAQSLKGTFTPWDWIAGAASGMATMMSVISAIHSSTGYANGGMVKGNSYSGDNIPAMIDGGAGGFAGLNAGEIVLNKAAQGNLASQLQGAGMGGMQVIGEISGEKIVLVANRFFKRTGQGEIVTW